MTAKTIIIGAGGATGQALCEALKHKGADLFVTARTQEDLDHTGCDGAIVDVTDESALQEAIAGADDGDGFAGLAYCVGSIVLKPMKAAKLDEYMNTYQVNVLGAITALKAAEKGLKKANGSVVLFSTVAVQQRFNNHTVISTAKGAIEGLTRSLAAEWAPKVRVNAIAPSLSDTKMAAPLLSSDQMRDAIAGMHPINRLGTGADLAAMAAFLLGEESSWVTGQIFGVDGGRSSLRIKS